MKGRCDARVITALGAFVLVVGCGGVAPSDVGSPIASEGDVVPQTATPLETAGGEFTGVLGAPAGAPLSSPLPLPACTYADVPVETPAYDDWSRTLVDTTYTLPRSYVPPDLVPVSRTGIAGSGQIRAIVVDDLRALASAARSAGAPLAVRSAYRSYRRQGSVFAGWVAVSGWDEAIRFSARPGHSEHQLGTAIDLQAAGGAAPWQTEFAATAQGRWLKRNSWRFGFVVSYPPGSEAIVCYGSEAWHVRYVGRDVAKAVHRSKLTLREWLWLHGD